MCPSFGAQSFEGIGIMDQIIDKLEKLHKNSSPIPWKVVEDKRSYATFRGISTGNERTQRVVDIFSTFVSGEEISGPSISIEDAELITTIRNSLPQFIEILKIAKTIVDYADDGDRLIIEDFMKVVNNLSNILPKD